jgi:hypothetical protein
MVLHTAATAARWLARLDGTIDVTQVFSTGDAFAALRADGSVVSWGDSPSGGDSAAVAAQLDGTIDVTRGVFDLREAFAALRADGSVVVWGDSSYGGDSQRGRGAARRHGRRDGGVFDGPCLCRIARRRLGGHLGRSVVRRRQRGGCSTARRDDRRDAGVLDRLAFAALRADGSVVTWGNPAHGGNSSAVGAQARRCTIDVTQVFSTLHAFAALRADGSLVTWGDSSSGGNSSPVAAQLDGTIDVTQVFSTEEAFGALRADGSVVTGALPAREATSVRLP